MILSEEDKTSLITKNFLEVKTLQNILSLDVPTFKQERTYWCGPATVKQTVHFLSNGTNSPTQTQIAGYIGTTTAGSSSTYMANWLASHGYYYYSVSTSSMTSRDLVNYSAADLGTYGMPPFGGVAIATSNLRPSGATHGWMYTTGGHFLNISELWYMEPNYGDSLIYVSDPYIPWVYPTMSGYFVTANEYMNVITSFWW